VALATRGAGSNRRVGHGRHDVQKREIRGLATLHDCHRIPTWITQWETRYEGLVEEGWDIYLSIEIDVGLMDSPGAEMKVDLCGRRRRWLLMLATIAAVTVAVIVILAALWYMRRKMREDFDEATEHIDSGDPDAAHVKGSSSIPIRARASGLSMTAKVMFGAIGGIILIVGLFAFETIRTGSPAEVMFADQLITGAQVAAGVVVGIVGVNMAQKSVGWHHVVYETESGDVQTESVPINVSGMEADTEGNAVVSEYARTRVLGLFRRTKHVAEDATLDGTHRAPGKPIKHQIPQHAIAIGENEWITRTAKQTPTQSPDVEADYVYSSPIELSYDKFVGMKESNRRKDIRLTSLESTVAVLEKNLRNWSAASRAGSTKRNSRSSRRSNRSATLSVRRRRNPTGSRIRVIRTSTLATPNRTAAGRRPPMEAPNEHPSHSRRITGHNGSVARRGGRRCGTRHRRIDTDDPVPNGRRRERTTGPFALFAVGAGGERTNRAVGRGRPTP